MHITWKSITDSEPDILTSGLAGLDFGRDCQAQLPELEDYISFLKHPSSSDSSRKTFTPLQVVNRFTSSKLPLIQRSNDKYSVYVLAAYESWVASELSGWLESRLLDPLTCGHLFRSMRAYHTEAASQYKGNPREHLSHASHLPGTVDSL